MRLRNSDILFGIEYYDAIFLKNRDIQKNIETDTYILEKLDALFRIKGKEEEIAAIQVFLYEFVRNLDEHESLCERLIQKAMTYFEKNKDKNDIEFRSALVEIPFRKIEYLLATQLGKSEAEIKRVILEDIFDLIGINPVLLRIETDNKTFLSAKNALTIEQRQVVAKVWLYLAELNCYTNDLEKSLSYVKMTMEFLYEEDKKVWLVLAASLRGFIHQSMGNFDRAEKWHIRAKEIALGLLESLIIEKKELQNSKNSSTRDIYRNRYRIHFTLKTLSRAIGKSKFENSIRRIIDGKCHKFSESH